MNKERLIDKATKASDVIDMATIGAGVVITSSELIAAGGLGILATDLFRWKRKFAQKKDR